MIYELTDEQRRIVERYNTFAKTELAPQAARLDESPGEKTLGLMSENLKKVAGLGFLGLIHDQAYSGSGHDWVTLAVAGEAIASACPSTYLSSFASACLFGMSLERFGSGDQKEKYLPGIIGGGLVGCCALVESAVAGDATAVSVEAVESGNSWILRGGTSLITNAPIAGAFLVPARTAAGMTVFVVDRDRPGLSISAPVDKMGYRGSPTAGIAFDDCLVPAAAVLGEAGKGLGQMERVLNDGRIGMAVASLGIAAGCLEESRRYALKKKSGGMPIGRHQEVAFKLADMVIMTDLARLLIYKACWAADKNDPESSVLAACAKVFAAEAAAQSANMAMQISGGEGYLKRSAVERLYRDAKLGDICWGTSERQRIFVGTEVLAGFRVEL